MWHKNKNICEFLHNTNLTLSDGLNCETALGKMENWCSEKRFLDFSPSVCNTALSYCHPQGRGSRLRGGEKKCSWFKSRASPGLAWTFLYRELVLKLAFCSWMLKCVPAGEMTVPHRLRLVPICQPHLSEAKSYTGTKRDVLLSLGSSSLRYPRNAMTRQMEYPDLP